MWYAPELLDGLELRFVQLVEISVLGLQILDQRGIIGPVFLELLDGEFQRADLGCVEAVTHVIGLSLLKQCLSVLFVLVALSGELGDLAVLHHYGAEHTGAKDGQCDVEVFFHIDGVKVAI